MYVLYMYYPCTVHIKRIEELQVMAKFLLDFLFWFSISISLLTLPF